MRVTIMALVLGLSLAASAAAQIPPDPTLPATGAADASAAPAASPAGKSPGRALPPPFVTRQNDVEIPFSVRAGTTPDNQPTAVRVFVSWDRGRSWHFYDERKPADGRFRFRPKQDGEFWFATQTIDRSGHSDSQEPRQPQLRLIVDTQRPQLLVQAQVQTSGEVVLTWSAADPTLNAATLKIEYQDASGSGNWEGVAISPAGEATAGQTTGQARFRPTVASQSINLRAEIGDAGGNVAYFSQRLSLIPVQPKPAGEIAYAPRPDLSATQWPTDAATREQSPPGQWIVNDKTTPAQDAAVEQVLLPNLVENPFAGPGRLASSSQPQGTSAEELLPPAQPPASEPTTSATDADPLPDPGTDHSPGSPLGNDEFGPLPARSQPAADLPDHSPALRGGMETPLEHEPARPAGPEIMPAPQPSAPVRSTEPVDAPLGQRPRLTNSRRFSLDYDVEAVGPDGVATVELWGTTDGGRTWLKWGADPDRASPFDVEVNSEANYGYRIVIVGKNGLATSAPQPGDAADIWVGIDLTRPTARLTGASYGAGEAAGKLDIRWEANDANLSDRPVTLSIGDRPDGAFTPIAAGLPNSGQYYWEFDPRSPRQIYLRLEVRDEAGNIAIDQLTEPIKVEGLEPKGRIRGFSPGGESQRDAFRSPLFR